MEVDLGILTGIIFFRTLFFPPTASESPWLKIPDSTNALAVFP